MMASILIRISNLTCNQNPNTNPNTTANSRQSFYDHYFPLSVARTCHPRHSDRFSPVSNDVRPGGNFVPNLQVNFRMKTFSKCFRMPSPMFLINQRLSAHKSVQEDESAGANGGWAFHQCRRFAISSETCHLMSFLL